MTGKSSRRLTGMLEFHNRGCLIHAGSLVAALRQAGWDDAAEEILRRTREARAGWPDLDAAGWDQSRR